MGAYTIKQLEWKTGLDNKGAISITEFGSYYINPIFDENSRFLWFNVEYCFDEYYNEGHIGKASNLNNAKEMATKHWIETLEKVLIKIKS